MPDIAPQPAPHKSHVHTFIILMLVALMATETATLGYVITKPSGGSCVATNPAPTQQSVTPSAADSAQMENEVTAAPSFFTRSNGTGYPSLHNELVMVDPVTSKETVLFNGGQSQLVKIIAVPQTGYTGKIFIDLYPEGTEYWGFTLRVMDVATRQITRFPMEYDSKLELNEYYAVSPDQTRIAIISEIRQIEGDIPANLRVLNLLENSVMYSADREFNGWVLAEGEHWATEENHLGWTPDANIRWIDNDCFAATVYKEREDGKIVLHDSDRTFCIEETGLHQISP